MNKKILITGGGGYVGSLLCDKLTNENYEITVLDTFWFGNYLKKKKICNSSRKIFAMLIKLI